jgi:site-specific DNA-adenine methylase
MSVRTLSPRFGAKTRIASRIAQSFGSGYARYIEPCVGGGSVLLAAIRSGCAREYFASDSDLWLIGFYKRLQSDPDGVCEFMARGYSRFKSMLIEQQRAQLKQWRESECCVQRSMATRNSFMNDSSTPRGVGVDGLHALAREIANVRFACRSIDAVECDRGDLVFIDPPYAGTKTKGYSSVNSDCNWLRLWNSNARVLLTYDRVPDSVLQEQIVWKTDLTMPNKRQNTRTEILMQNRD